MSATDKAVRHAVIGRHQDRRSFNMAIGDAYGEAVEATGQKFVLRDLYRMRFNPALKGHQRPGSRHLELSSDVAAELEIVRGSNIVTFIYPIWFGMQPAMMKGYVARVIGSGVTPRQVEDGQGQGPLSSAQVLCLTTSGAREAWLEEQGQVEALRTLSSRYLFHAFSMKLAQTMQIGDIVEGPATRTVELHLHDVRERARKICAMLFAVHHSRSAPLGVWMAVDMPRRCLSASPSRRPC